MNNICITKVLIISFNDITSTLDKIENDDHFPIIDIDSLLTIIFDIFCNETDVKIENVLHYLMNSDCLTSRMDLDQVYTVKLESLIYNLLVLIYNHLQELKINDGILFYQYIKRRRNNNVLLERLQSK